MRVLVCAAIVFAAACGSDNSPTPPGGTNKAVDVYTLSSAFSPNFVEINQGDTVRFNIVPAADGDGHDVTFKAAAGAPANINVTRNGVVPRVFNTKGSFHYDCFVHPGMSGDVVVK